MRDFLKSYDFSSDSIIKALDEEDRMKVYSSFEPLNFSQDDKLFYEDGVPTGVFLIEKGKAKKYKTNFGDEQIFYIYKEGDLLGYHALLSNERYQDSCSALTEMKVKFISAENFNKLLDKIPKLKDLIMINMAHEFGVMANFIAVLAQKSQVLRLGIFLLVLNERFNIDGRNLNGINIPREDLANLIGTSRESLSRSLRDLKSKGFISIDKRTVHIVKKDEMLEFVQS